MTAAARLDRILLGPLLGVALVAALAPPADAAKAKKIRSVEGITEYQLDNGLQVLLFPDPSQPTVTVNITYLVGSRHEGYGETGMAHLLEHMMFKGTKKYRNVLKLIDARGGQANGTTWTDRTNYFETLTATEENLRWALDLERDRMRNATISKSDLSTEFSVVRNEFEMGENNPVGVLEERMAASSYLWHNYGKSTIGSRVDIERVPVPALRAFYDKYYQPDNAVLIVAGKFDAKKALAYIERTYGAIPRPKRKLLPTYTLEPVQDGERNVILRRNGDVHVVGTMYHTVGAAAPEYAPMNAAVDIIAKQPSGRLYKQIVETKLAASLSGYQYMFKDPNVAVFLAQVREPANVDKVEQAMIAAIEGLGSSKIEPSEVDRWRNAELKEYELAMTKSSTIAVVLSEAVAAGDWRMLFAYRDAVKKVTPADVQKAAKAYFKSSNRTAGRFIPTKTPDRAPLTESPDVQVAVKGVTEGSEMAAGEAFAATFENIEKRTTRTKLKNGLQAAFLPKKTRGGRVVVRLQLRWGDENNLKGKAIAAQLAVQMLSRGTTKKSYQDLEDTKDKLKTKIAIWGGAGGMLVSVETLKDQLPAAMDLVGEMLTQSAFPAKELEVVRQQTLSQLEQQLQDPSALAWNELQRVTDPWPKDDPRATLTIPEQIAAVKKVSLDEIKAFYKAYIGASHGELSVVGDFDPKQLTAQVEKVLAGWTSKQPYARLKQKVFDVPGTTKTLDTKDKEMAQLAAGHGVPMKSDDPDYAAWLVTGQILGGDTGSRIWMRLREKEGLSYGAWGYTYADDEDPSGGVGIGAIVAPQNLGKAKASLIEETQKITSGNITSEELERAKDGWLKSQDTNLANDNWVASKLANSLKVGRTLDWDIKHRARVKAVTSQDVTKVARKYVDPKKLVVIEAGDMAKAKK